MPGTTPTAVWLISLLDDTGHARSTDAVTLRREDIPSAVAELESGQPCDYILRSAISRAHWVVDQAGERVALATLEDIHSPTT